MRRSGRVGKDMEQEVDLGGPPAEEGLGKGGVRSEAQGGRTSAPTGRGGHDCSKNQVSYVHGSK